ncbi:MAG: choloylglycine hydrolase [Oscillospiraceae bacterium]|nr:choloylglycine hydrolase [Oscillospiraceae bacterium]
MCTAVTYKTKDHYFGRNLDLEYSYGETVTITPRNYPFSFRTLGKMEHHFAMIGMAHVAEGYPLYYDATNEKGLSMAGLNFPDNADYKPYCVGKDNIAPFELIPWILGQCATVAEAETLLRRINLLCENFSQELPLSPLHWIISDAERSITLESVKEGIVVYDNPIGVLCNNPPFGYLMFNLNNYMHLSVNEPKNTFSGRLELKPYSRAMGAMGLPGDVSSMSRFVRAAFVKMNAVSDDSEAQSVSQFFHILKSVEMQRGCVVLDEDVYDLTVYSSCCNTGKGIYYYTTYDNSQICAVQMHKEDLQARTVVSYPLCKEQAFFYQNG